MKSTLTAAALTALLAAAPAAAPAQSAAPAATMAPATTMPMASSAPAAAPTYAPTYAPANSMPASAAPSTSAPSTAAPSNNGGHGVDEGRGSNAMSKADKLKHVKKVQNGNLSTSDLRYALTHPAEEVGKVRKMKSISFDKLRVYRLSSGLKSMLKVGDANADIPVLAVLGPGLQIAQAGTPAVNGSNSPIAILQSVLANINVSNALNNVNVLNNSTVNVGVSLADVLNGNKISIGSVVGLFVNSLGIITTITK